MDNTARMREASGSRLSAGFSLLEMLVSVALITVIMSAVFSFMYQAQKRFQGNTVVSESNQSARAAMEVLTQEIGQAAYNTNFSNYKQINNTINGTSGPQCVTLYNSAGTANSNQDISGINPGDWLAVDTGDNNEWVQVLATSNTPDPAGVCTGSPVPKSCPCSGGPCSTSTANSCQIKAVFAMDHVSPGTTTPFPVLSYKFPYPTGILTGTVNGQTSTSSDKTLEIYGDINNNGTILYNVYSLSATTSPATTVSITTGACNGTYTLYNLYRSSTPVRYPASNIAGSTTYTSYLNNTASPLVQNVLYDTANARGPTCEPVFGYPNSFVVGFTPSQISVIGTIVVTLSVAVNPQRLESGIIEWYTMATQIRPLNLAATVSVNQIGGYKFLPQAPLDLPMANPTSYYQ